MARLRRISRRVSEKGRKLRLWATPDTPEVWDILLECDVDVIGADDLGGLEDYLRGANGKK